MINWICVSWFCYKFLFLFIFSFSSVTSFYFYFYLACFTILTIFSFICLLSFTICHLLLKNKDSVGNKFLDFYRLSSDSNAYNDIFVMLF